MQKPVPQPHVYQRDISQLERSSLSVLANHITANSHVLDLGCGTGALGRWLNKTAPSVVHGVTLSQIEAAQALGCYQKVVVSDLESLVLTDHFEREHYDFIVCADVLEHLKQPEQILIACRQLLKPTGRLLISMPNAAYAGLVAELMHGNFDYRDEGLLDRTHLRFFTRSTLTTFLTSSGWHLQTVEPILREMVDSEFQHAFDTLPPSVSRYLLCTDDALTYQFVVSCSQAELPGDQQPLQTGVSPPAKALFSAELFVGNESGFSQQSKLTARGEIGNKLQTLRFDWDRDFVPNASRLRLDPADRAGFLHLHAMRLTSNNQNLIWEWRGGISLESQLDQGHVLSQQIFWHLPGAALLTPMLLLLGEDPWFEIPIPAHFIEQASLLGATLEVDLGWPISADYLFAAQQITDLRQREKQLIEENQRALALHHDSQLKWHANKQALLEQTSVTQQALETEMAKKEIDFQERLAATSIKLQEARIATQQMQASLDAEIANAGQQLLRAQSDTEQKSVTWQTERLRLLNVERRLTTEKNSLEADLNQLRSHLNWIENSTVFRATRPIVHAKMALQRLIAPPAALPLPPVPEPMHLPKVHVDVIVPVYRGLFDTQRCISSALASSCNTPFRLIVINDCSPEPEVTQWLRDLAATDQRIKLLENEENLGFVATVNRGMELEPNNDVLLLNSDTEVANDWLDRLQRTAYSGNKVASVTPFSNNATICSYPKFCEPNPLVEGHTTASLDAICAKTNPGASVDIPTGVGFCMYIRRDCLTEVGFFDVTNFGKGYGEENDFCCRASAAGWRNLHALDVFVLHAGGVSFGDSKRARELAAMETLRRLHPRYESDVTRFVQLDPAKDYRHTLDLARLAQSPLFKVLAVIHDRAGGTKRHVMELATSLSAQGFFLCLTPLPGNRVELKWVDESEDFQLVFSHDTDFDSLLQTLNAAGVSLVHFHHLLGHNPVVESIPRRLNVPFDFTAHDHYSHCPQISLTDHTNQYCGEKGESQCNGCLNRSPAPGGVDIRTWRNNHKTFLQEARYILAPSRDTARRMAALVPTAETCVAPHTDIAAQMALPAPRAGNRPSTDPLKVVVIGALSVIKGADILESVALAAKKAQAPIEFHLVGYAYRNLKTRTTSNLTVHGEYKDAELAAMLEWLKPDVVWFPALWPETYSYTLSACLGAGLPVIAPDLGAFPERLHLRPWSWVQAWNTSVEDWLKFFDQIHLQNFIPSSPPAVWADPAAARSSGPAWSYAVSYFPKSASNVVAAPTPSAEWLSCYRSGRTPSGLKGADLSARKQLLIAVVKMRSMPMLRDLAKAVPLRWQTRIKSWLVR